jgi:hypothetical protein
VVNLLGDAKVVPPVSNYFLETFTAYWRDQTFAKAFVDFDELEMGAEFKGFVWLHAW